MYGNKINTDLKNQLKGICDNYNVKDVTWKWYLFKKLNVTQKNESSSVIPGFEEIDMVKLEMTSTGKYEK